MAAEGDDGMLTKKEIQQLIADFSKRMQDAADQMEFELAAQFRDRVLVLKDMDLGLKPPLRTLVQQAVAPKKDENPRYRKASAKAARKRK
jgi:excinuclease ABC subunit B